MRQISGKEDLLLLSRRFTPRGLGYWVRASMPGPATRFVDLDAWMHSRQLVNGVYRLTLEGRLCRDFGLTSQIQRAAVSVMSNLAEGFERAHPAEKRQAYNVARGSAAEVQSSLYVVEDNFPETAPSVARLRSTIVTIGRLVTGLIKSIGRRDEP